MTKYAYGIQSNCKDGNHIYMGDIDESISPKNLTILCGNLVKGYFLSDIYIVSSTCGYNIYSLDKLPLKMVYKINKETKEIDKQFAELQYKERGFYVLRIGGDKNLVSIYSSDNTVWNRSNAHRIFFNSFYDIDIQKDYTFDDQDHIKIIKFKNIKHGWD